MKNNSWLVILVLVVLAGGAYMYRHQLKTMLMGTPVPAVQTTTVTPSTAMAPSDNIYKTMTDAAKGAYLTDFQGMTLYSFDKDTAGVSNCSGSCVTLWPPYTSGATAQDTMPANITVIIRTDGTKQFAWNSMPLYYYSKDAKAGDLTGDGVGGVWHLVKP
jgi:predicted lipoprotein with Yx(FWY)xxD motif